MKSGMSCEWMPRKIVFKFFGITKVIDTRDKNFTEPGKIGLWTKEDSVTYFDDLTVEAKEGR
jgi:hypothetical protein